MNDKPNRDFKYVLPKGKSYQTKLDDTKKRGIDWYFVIGIKEGDTNERVVASADGMEPLADIMCAIEREEATLGKQWTKLRVLKGVHYGFGKCKDLEGSKQGFGAPLY